MTEIYGRDPTRPQAPAFTKLQARTDIMERKPKRKREGLISHPMLYAKLDHNKGGGGGRSN
jgi:hypothetical protein